MTTQLYILRCGDVVAVPTVKFDDEYLYVRDRDTNKVRKLMRRGGKDGTVYYSTEAEALRAALVSRRRQAIQAESQLSHAQEEKVEKDANLVATRQALAECGDNLPGYEAAVREEVKTIFERKSYDVPELREQLNDLVNANVLAPFEVIEMRVLVEAFAQYDSEPAIRERITKSLGEFNPSSTFRVQNARHKVEKLENLPVEDRNPGYEIALRITRELAEAIEAYEKTDEAVRARVQHRIRTYPSSAQKRFSDLKSKEEFGFLSPEDEVELRVTREFCKKK